MDGDRAAVTTGNFPSIVKLKPSPVDSTVTQCESSTLLIRDGEILQEETVSPFVTLDFVNVETNNYNVRYLTGRP